MVLLPYEPCDQFVSHHRGGRPLASSEWRVQVSDLGLSLASRRVANVTVARFVAALLNGRANLGVGTPGFKVQCDKEGAICDISSGDFSVLNTILRSF